MPLPHISPSVIPAPKHSGHYESAPAGSFWASESQNYWDKRRRNKLSGRRGVVVLVLLAASTIIVFLLIEATLRRKPEAAENVIGEDVASTSGTEPGGILVRKQACIESGLKNKLEVLTCAKACAKARTAPPRPLAHRSCLAGCRNGISAGWELGCAGGRRQDCTRPASAQCDHQCGTYRNQFPKPTIFNTCQRACLDIVEDACAKSKDTLVETEALGIAYRTEL